MTDESDDRYNLNKYLEDKLEKEFEEIQESFKQLEADYLEMKRKRKEQGYTQDLIDEETSDNA